MLVGPGPEPVGVGPQAIGDRAGCVKGSLVKLVGAGAQLVGVVIGTHAVPAAGYAPVEGGDVPDAFPRAQGRVVPVEAQEQGVRVVVEG